MAKTKKSQQAIIPGLEDKITVKPKNTVPFIKMSNTIEALQVAFDRKENIILFGPGGHGKSSVAEWFLLQKGIQPFIKTLGAGTSIEDLFGGFNMSLFQKEGVIEYLVENSFMNHEYVILEEVFDAQDFVLEQLKDILSSRVFRNGTQQFPIKTKMIICCTNKERTSIAKNASLVALMERFKYEHHVKWDSYNQKDYSQLFKQSINTDCLFIEQLCHLHHQANKTISPRIAIEAAITYLEHGPKALNYLAGIDADLLKKHSINFKNKLILDEMEAKFDDLMNNNSLSNEVKMNIIKNENIQGKVNSLVFEAEYSADIKKTSDLKNKIQSFLDIAIKEQTVKKAVTDIENIDTPL